jgi:hypothetical protein
MTEPMTCPSKEDLVTWLYGEADDPARAACEAHLRQCAACRDETEALTAVRVGLASWTAPDLPVHVQVVPDAPPRSLRGLLMRPSFALAAAATLVLGVSAGLANLEVRYGDDGLTVRTGWARGRAAAPASTAADRRGAVAGGDLVAASAPAAATPDTRDAAWRDELAALEQRLRADFQGRLSGPGAAASTDLVAVRTAPADTSGRSGALDPELVRRIQALVDESEVRQQRNLALRVAELSRDFDLQRKADLVQFQQGLGQLEGRTTVENARTRELMDYIIRVSQQPPR